MIGAAEMCSIDVLNKQNTEFTYIKKYQSLIITSWIDHIFVLNNCSQKVKYVKILGKLANNVSDHLPISLLYKLEINYSQKTIINDDDIKIKEFNWLNPFLRDYYFSEINRNGTNINSKLQKLKNCEDIQYKSIVASELLNEISLTLINANLETLKHKEKLKTDQNNKSRSNFKKNKKWWNERLYELHKFSIRPIKF